MKTIILVDNVSGDTKIKVDVSEKHYKVMKYLKTCGGFLRFNMELYSETKGVRGGTDKAKLLPFLYDVFSNKSLIESYFK